MNLFIDTNIYLTFYHFTSDDLEQLKKLVVAIKDKEIRVYLTSHVVDEFRRNRESKIADALKKLDEQKIPNQFPQFCKEYDEYKKLRYFKKRYEFSKNKLMEKMMDDIRNKQLKADQVINEIFDRAILITATDDIFALAKSRYDRGNPPGKGTSYGDALNWLSLLYNIPHNEDLHFIARDKDYFSVVDPSQLSEYLSDEWRDKKGSEVQAYTSLSDFFGKHFPDIKLASELEKKMAIRALVNSWNFAETHEHIKKLLQYSEYTIEEIEQLLEGAINNSQVGGIIADEDIKQFYLNLIANKEDSLDPDKLDNFYSLFPEDVDEKTEFPF